MVWATPSLEACLTPRLACWSMLTQFCRPPIDVTGVTEKSSICQSPTENLGPHRPTALQDQRISSAAQFLGYSQQG